MHLLGSADGFAVFALTQRECNGCNHGHQQNSRCHLNGHEVFGVKQDTQGLAIGNLRPNLTHSNGHFRRLRSSKTTHQHSRHFECNEGTQRGSQGKVFPEALTQSVQVKVKHHDHKQK